MSTQVTDTAKQKAILDFSRSLEWHSRGDGSEYCALADDRLNWMVALVMECHDDHMPDDGTYKMIWQVAGELANMIADGCDMDDDLWHRLDSLAPFERIGLINWEATCSLADDAIAEALSEGLVDVQASDFSIHTLRMAGWMVAAERIAHTILAACEAQAELD